jgi:hypothetical protein
MVDYPTYMQTQHQTWLGALASAITTAAADNPFAVAPTDPGTDTTAMATAIGTFQTIISAMDYHTVYDSIHTAAAAQVDATISPETYISARMIAHATALDAEINSKVIPRFNAGMRDLNAVQTSAFVLGRAIIEVDRNDKVDKFMADMRFQADDKRGSLIQSVAGEMVRLYLQKIEFSRVIAALTMDQLRLKIAARSDYETELKSISADEERWPLECYKYGANMLASVGGGVTSSVPVDGNKTARIIGSGLSGAVAGAMIGGSINGNEGAGYGALLGGLAGMLGGGS